MKCKYCETVNEEDALFCKKCGNFLRDNYKEKKNKEKVKTKTKTKIKKKIKKVKVKDKNKNKNNKKNSQVVYKTSFAQKMFIFLLIIFILILLAVIGYGAYYYYNKENVLVPNVVGLSYDEAVSKLNSSKLGIIKIDEETTDDIDDGVVLSQNKNPNTKVKSWSKIRVYVGKVKTYKLSSFIGKNIDDVTSILDKNNISYIVNYIDSNKDSGEVLSQSPNGGELIKVTEKIHLTVSKHEVEEEDNESFDMDEETDSEEDEF